MEINDLIFKELVRRGYSIKGENKVWNISDSKLWYLTPELAQGFLNLKNYNPYKTKVIDTEIEMINKHEEKLLFLFNAKSFNLIDLGCGDGLKASTFIKNLPEGFKVRYCAVDISQHYLDLASKAISDINSDKVVEIKTFTSDFNDLDNLIGLLSSREYKRNIIFLLGETISHYEVNELLYKIENSMQKGDIILIGNGYRVGERFVEIDKYKDELFHKWFFNIVKGLGFEENEVSYSPRFANDRLEFFYKILKDKEIEHKGRKVSFKKGDEIIVGCQYKYYEDEWTEFLDIYFCKVYVLKDTVKEYAFYLCEK